VVAVEPQPDFARLLRVLFAGASDVHVVEAAVGAAPGRASLAISERTPTVTTAAAAWRDAREGEPDFSHVRWQRRVEVEMTTMDALIERYGAPAFVKIDVEGAEPGVLAGLSRPVPALAFEYLPRALDFARDCLARMDALGRYEFNWSSGESYRLAAPRWMSAADLIASLETPAAQRRPGDVYARLQRLGAPS
jgi:FkbM family methyltransferase